MGKSLDLKPSSGDYFTGADVNPMVLPQTPQKPPPSSAPPPPRIQTPKGFPFNQKPLWNQQAGRIATGKETILSNAPPPPPNRSGSARAGPPEINNNGIPPPEDESGSQKITSPYLRFFLSPNLKRAQGNPASVWTIKVTTEKNGKQTKMYQEFHLIVCWYQFLIGALGGTAVGVETEFFSASRFSEPKVPIPDRLNLIRQAARFAIQKSSSMYRLCKRAAISGYIFDVIDKNVEEHRDKQDWKNMGISGCITGALFGLRGGFRGSLVGSLIFGGFASIAGFQYYWMKKPKPSK